MIDVCNLCCKYCVYGEFYNDYDKCENSIISLFVFLKLIDYLVDLWGLEYNMLVKCNVYISFYGGEFLLNMLFIELVVMYIEKLYC